MSKTRKFKTFRDMLYPLHMEIRYICDSYRLDITAFCPPDITLGMSVTEYSYRAAKNKKVLADNIKRKLGNEINKQIINNFLNEKNTKTPYNIIITTLLKEDEIRTVMHPRLYMKKGL